MSPRKTFNGKLKQAFAYISDEIFDELDSELNGTRYEYATYDIDGAFHRPLDGLDRLEGMQKIELLCAYVYNDRKTTKATP